MKIVIVTLTVLLSTAAFAKETKKSGRHIASEEIKCSANDGAMDPEYITNQISAAESCYQAAKIAESCAFGSSLDNQIAGTAESVCDKATGKVSKSDQKLRKMMTDRCGKMCNPRTDGTLCQAEQAFCRLDASKFINSVNSAD